MSSGYDRIFKAANEAAVATGREYVVVKINGAVRLLPLNEFFELPPETEVELLHATVALRVRGGLVTGTTDGVQPRHTYRPPEPHQASHRIGAIHRREHERSKLAKFFRDLFGRLSGVLWILVTAVGIATSLVGCGNAPTEPRLICMDYADTTSNTVTAGPCTLEARP